MEPISIGEFEYFKKDLIGHGAFAVVFKGRFKKVRNKENVVVARLLHFFLSFFLWLMALRLYMAPDCSGT